MASGRLPGVFRRLLGGSDKVYEASRWVLGAKAANSLVFIKVLGVPRVSQGSPGAESIYPEEGK